MNIFQLLGLPALHRKENKVTQLVKHYAEVNQKHKDNKRLAIQLKKDGVCSITVIINSVVTIFSRTGKKFTNTCHLRQSISDMNLRDGVYFGEMTCPTVSLEVLSGKVNPNRVKPLSETDPVPYNLVMNFFDLISIESFKKGTSNTPFQTRYNNLVERIYEPCVEGVVPSNINVINLLPVDPNQIESFLNIAVKNGEEGIVIIDLDADWEAGHKGWRKMKLVRGCDYDLRCISYEEGTGKYAGKVANLVFQWKDGKTIKCMLGKGWTHEMAEDMFKAIKEIERNGSMSSKHVQHLNPLDRIFQVYALEESSKGKLRLPKVGEQRFDKTQADI